MSALDSKHKQMSRFLVALLFCTAIGCASADDCASNLNRAEELRALDDLYAANNIVLAMLKENQSDLVCKSDAFGSGVRVCMTYDADALFQRCAETLLEKAAELPKTDKNIWGLTGRLASVYLEQRQYSKAELVLQKSLTTIDDEKVEGLYAVLAGNAKAVLGEIYYEQGQYLAAAQTLEQALTLQRSSMNPSDPSTTLALANAYSKLQRYEDAAELFEYGIDELQKFLGKVAQSSLKLADALDEFSKVLVVLQRKDEAEAAEKRSVDIRAAIVGN